MLRYFPLVAACLSTLALADELPPIRFNKNFEGASLGNIEAVAPDHYRLQVLGQANEFGRNRQPTWYCFRLEGVKGRQISLTLTDFKGEYDNKPAVAMRAELRPVFSYDGEKWEHFTAAAWGDAAKEMTLTFTPAADTITIAHAQPYTHARLLRLLPELAAKPSALVEVIGRTTQGRELHQITVTDFSKPDAGKRCVWLQARQHAWESGTSYAMEGALRFITSDDPAAVALRERVVFKFTPMVDPDGTVLGNVRFNVNGFDVNRHWTEVDLRNPRYLQQMPEIWYAKKAILAAHARQPIDLFINMHNTETAEYMDTQIEGGTSAAEVFTEAFRRLKEATMFDPSRVPNMAPSANLGTTNDLWAVAKVPVALMELRIGPSTKLGRRPTAEDRLQFGAQLIRVLGEVALEKAR